MARVNLAGNAVKKFTHGESLIEVEADNFRRLVLELDRRFPGLGHQVEEGMAIAIDGEIYQDAYAARFTQESEVWLIPKIAGG
jgi:sulfur-carrier protein